MPTMMLRVLFLVAAVAVAAGGFVMGACSYELDRAEALHGFPGALPLHGPR
jgi:hypothetical protein